MHLFRLNDSLTNFCRIQEPIYSNDLRLLIVGIFGSSVSIISVVENLILFYVFATSRKLRRQNYANPVLLASFDILVSVGYFFTESAHFFAFRLESIELALLWAKYMRLAYCVQHFSLTVSNFLLVVASLERFLANGPYYSQKRVLVFMVRYKALVIVIILMLAFLFKATVLLENTVLLLPQCPSIISFVPIWRYTDTAAEVRFWLRKIFTIILPFFVLAYCNFYIVLHLRNRHRFYKSNCRLLQAGKNNSNSKNTINYSSNTVTDKAYCDHNRSSCSKWRNSKKQKSQSDSFESSQCDSTISFSKFPSPLPLPSQLPYIQPYSHSTHSPHRTNPCPKDDKRGVRIATRTLVMVVGCYLISNSMTTIINIWENLNQNFLRYDHFDAYFIASDIAALLTICGCALRLPIYVVNDRRIRNAIFRALIRCRYCYRRSGFQNLAADANFDCEKWSIIIVSNSLRSNLTGLLSQVDLAAFKEKKSFDQLAILVQNRRRFLVQMTINLGTVEELPEEKDAMKIYDHDEPTCLTELHEEENTDDVVIGVRNAHKRKNMRRNSYENHRLLATYEGLANKKRKSFSNCSKARLKAIVESLDQNI